MHTRYKRAITVYPSSLSSLLTGWRCCLGPRARGWDKLYLLLRAFASFIPQVCIHPARTYLEEEGNSRSGHLTHAYLPRASFLQKGKNGKQLGGVRISRPEIGCDCLRIRPWPTRTPPTAVLVEFLLSCHA